MAENIEFRLKVIEDKLGVVLEQNEKKAKSLGTALQVAIGSFASTSVTKGISLLADGFRNLNSFVIDSVDAAAQSEEALKRLEVALSQTGQLSEDNVKSFQDFASEIQKTTAFEDDLVISNIALIQSLARLDNEGLKKATQAALDLSVALGIDLETASRIVGKAAEGSTGALQKLGIEFQKGGTEAETFGNILKSIETRFGGAAQAQAKTFAGAIAQLSNIWGDLKENIGAAITQNPAIIAAFNVLKDAALKLGESIKGAFGADTQEAFADLVRLIFDGTAAILTVIDPIGRAFTATVEISLAAIRLLALGLTTPVAATLELLALIPRIGDAFRGAADAATNEVLRLSEAYDQNIKALTESVTGETFISRAIDEIAEARGNFDVFYNEIKNKSSDLQNNKVSVIDETQTERLRTLNSELLDIENQYYLASNQLEEEQRIAEKERFISRNEEDLKSLQDFEMTKSELLFQSAINRADATLKGEELRIAKEKALRERELRDLQLNNKFKSDLRQIEIRDQQQFFSAAISLSSAKNKELATIGKAAAIGEIAIKTPQAVASSYAFGTKAGGPVLGSVFAAIAATAMAAQAARIAGIQGFADGGIVGATQGTDNRMATVRDGEMILNADQQKRLFDMINSGGMGGDIVVQIDSREVARAIRNQERAGYKFA